MKDSNSKAVFQKIKPCNELSDNKPKLNYTELVEALYDLQDELNAHGYEDCAQLIHRAAGRLNLKSLNEEAVKRMEAKLGNNAS